ncbi:DUF1007 family protein [Neorhizobium sp. NCHU2750]|uniref:DUF1007 family protein n=1 Tax=Neorhizobium sp. NCHU2750 TaxID=1825976 RepID=UPI000E76E655|nr:hypothetical protein NCHU2750_51310 [Neorhizobium sp. NCHU2750]
MKLVNVAMTLGCATAGIAFMSTPALAHPHVFADGKAYLETDPIRELLAVRNTWTFDAPFSAFAVTGLDKNHDHKLEPDELKPLAATSMKALEEYHFFSWVTSKGKQVDLAPPRDASYRFEHGRLTLTFTMPLKQPVPLDGDLKVEVFDPEYFVAYTFPDHDAVAIDGKAPGCEAHYVPPKPLDSKMMAALAAIPVDQHDLPPALADAAVGLANIFTVTCQ